LCALQERAPILHTLENATELVVSRLALRKQSIACPKDLRQVMILLEVRIALLPFHSLFFSLFEQGRSFFASACIRTRWC
jgi:hypothetical protein